MSIIRYVSQDGIAAVGLVCSISSGAVLPAPGPIADLSLEDSHVCSWFAQGMAMMNVDVSLVWKQCSGTTVAVARTWRHGHWLPFCLGKFLQPLAALGLHVA